MPSDSGSSSASESDLDLDAAFGLEVGKSSPEMVELRAQCEAVEAARLEMRAKVTQAEMEYEERVRAMAKARQDTVLGGGDGQQVRAFWGRALANCNGPQSLICQVDLPALEFLQEIKFQYLAPLTRESGFKLLFLFAENPFFANEVLEVTYQAFRPAFIPDWMVRSICASPVEWKEGGNFTEITKTKKRKGGGKKKMKPQTVTEDVPSFFRDFFPLEMTQSLQPAPGSSLAKFLVEHLEEVDAEGYEALWKMKEKSDDKMLFKHQCSEILDGRMDELFSYGTHIRDSLIPFALKWYTDEAAPSESDDDDDDDDEDEDTVAPGVGGKPAGQEECKQQ